MPNHSSGNSPFSNHSSLASLVTGLSNAQLTNGAASRGVLPTSSTHGGVNFADFSVSNVTPTMKFDTHQALLAATAQNGGMNPLNMLDTSSLRPPGTTIGFFDPRNGLQSVTLGFPSGFKLESPATSMNSTINKNDLREVPSSVSLDEHGNLDGSLLSTFSNSTVNLHGGQHNSSVDDDGSDGSGEDSESPNSNELQMNGVVGGQGKRGNGRSSGKRSGGVGSRPHRQNFTPTQNRILTEWYATHQYKPYPSTEDTKALAIKSALTYSQVSFFL